MAGKRSSKQNPQKRPIGSHSSLTLRQERSGKFQPSVVARNTKSFLKLDHLQKLAVWASREASIPPLAAFFGRQFAATSESMGAPPDPSMLPCQRCETILQPGFNCTIRIKKTRMKERSKGKRPTTLTKNSVVFQCHFCSHQNRKRGTSKCHMKDICPSKAELKPTKLIPQTCTEDARVQDEIIMEGTSLPAISRDCSIANSPVTPPVKSGTTLLDAKKRNRKRSVSKKPEESDTNSVVTTTTGNASTSRKRKRKPGMSLKEMAASNEHDSKQKLADFTIPFIL